MLERLRPKAAQGMFRWGRQDSLLIARTSADTPKIADGRAVPTAGSEPGVGLRETKEAQHQGDDSMPHPF